MHKNSAPDIIKAIGEDYFTDVLGFTQRNLRHVRATGTFASQWYAEISSACIEHGVGCPLSAFNMKVVDKQLGNEFAQLQDIGYKKPRASDQVGAA